MTPNPRVMLLIDADNVSTDVVEQAISRLHAEYGALHVRRAYGTAEAAVKHQALFKRLSIRPMVNLAAGKNSTDIAMAVDAIDLVIAERPDVVVIASSDSDFAPLVSRIREKGCLVRGVGQKGKVGEETPLIYDDFIEFEHRRPRTRGAATADAAAPDTPRRGRGRTAAKRATASSRSARAPEGAAAPGMSEAVEAAVEAPAPVAPAEAARTRRTPARKTAARKTPARATRKSATPEAAPPAEAPPAEAPPAEVPPAGASARPARKAAARKTTTGASTRRARGAAAGADAAPPREAPAAEVPTSEAAAAPAAAGAAVSAAPAKKTTRRTASRKTAAEPAAPAAAAAALPPMPDKVARALAVLPQLAAGQRIDVQNAAAALRKERVFSNADSWPKFFERYKEWFELTPAARPTHVQRRTPG